MSIDDYYLSVICSPDDTRTFDDFRARAAADGKTEYRTASMVYHEWSRPMPIETVDPWWHTLVVDDHIEAIAPGTAVLDGAGKHVLSRAPGQRMAVSSVDIEGQRIGVWPVGRKPFTDGLWVSALAVRRV